MSSTADRVVISRAPRTGFRWYFKATNGTVLAQGDHHYTNRMDALHAASRVVGFRARGVVVDPKTDNLYGYFEMPDRTYPVEVVSW